MDDDEIWIELNLDDIDFDDMDDDDYGYSAQEMDKDMAFFEDLEELIDDPNYMEFE
nr:hypothetical protein 3 [Cardiobacteriales bacterium]